MTKVHTFFERCRTWGMRKVVSHYSHAVIKLLSPHYRWNPEGYRDRGAVSFLGFVMSDFLRHRIDWLLRRAGSVLTRRRQLLWRDLTPVSLYYVDGTRLSSGSIVYSAGVGTNIDFDRELVRRFGCQVWLFDPTPPAVLFMAREEPLSNLHFDAVGVWTSTGPMRFYADSNAQSPRNLSIPNYFNTDTFIEAPCKTLSALMQERGHRRIDLLKLDIEGAALPVIESMLGGPLRPGQIVAELEMPQLLHGASIRDVVSFVRKKQKLFSRLNAEGYRIATYGKGEFIAVQKRDLRHPAEYREGIA